MSTYVSVSRPARVKKLKPPSENSWRLISDFKLTQTQIDPFCLSRQLYLKKLAVQKTSKMPKEKRPLFVYLFIFISVHFLLYLYYLPL